MKKELFLKPIIKRIELDEDLILASGDDCRAEGCTEYCPTVCHSDLCPGFTPSDSCGYYCTPQYCDRDTWGRITCTSYCYHV